MTWTQPVSPPRSSRSPRRGYGSATPSSSARLARECNEYAAKLVADHPGPLRCFPRRSPDQCQGADVPEVGYALDTLKADGVSPVTSYERQVARRYHSFLPVMEELNRRKAVVYTHPTAANCCVKHAEHASSPIHDRIRHRHHSHHRRASCSPATRTKFTRTCAGSFSPMPAAPCRS